MAMISEDILRIIDYTMCHNEEKALVISAYEHNGSEKLDELLALIDCTGGMKQFCTYYDIDLDEELIPKMIHNFFRNIIDTADNTAHVR